MAKNEKARVPLPSSLWLFSFFRFAYRSVDFVARVNSPPLFACHSDLGLVVVLPLVLLSPCSQVFLGCLVWFVSVVFSPFLVLSCSFS
jgi:hypothetical protein